LCTIQVNERLFQVLDLALGQTSIQGSDRIRILSQKPIALRNILIVLLASRVI